MTTGGIGSGGPATPDVRALLLQLSLSNARALTSGLQQGDVLTAKVGQTLPDGSVALHVGGKTILASSQVPLPSDAMVRLQVQIAGNQPILKLLDPVVADQIRTSTPAVRAAHLGLPATPSALLVQQAFESVGAPLQAERMQAATKMIATLPADAATQRAQALGLLAKLNAPVTAPLIALAERSLAGATTACMPNVAAALQRVQTALQTHLVQSGQPLPTAGTPPTRLLGTVANTAQAATATNSAVPTGVPTAGASAGTSVVTSVATSVAGPLTTPSTAVSNAPGATAPAANTVANQPTGQPAAPIAPTGQPPPITTAPPIAGQASQTTPAGQPPIAAPPTAATPQPLAQSLGGSNAGSTLATSATPAPLLATPSTLIGQSQILTLLSHLAMPDGGRDGAKAVMQALAQAGIHPRAAPSDSAEIRQPTTWQSLATTMQATNLPATPAALPPQAALPPLVDLSLQMAAREQLAETVFKPHAMADYDAVIPLSMHVHQQPVPTRFAVAERTTTAGKATFVRVDTELSALGPLSIRLSGIEGSALSITIFAQGAAQPILAAALPPLAESLRELGITAGIRVADWDDIYG